MHRRRPFRTNHGPARQPSLAVGQHQAEQHGAVDPEHEVPLGRRAQHEQHGAARGHHPQDQEHGARPVTRRSIAPALALGLATARQEGIEPARTGQPHEHGPEEEEPHPHGLRFIGDHGHEHQGRGEGHARLHGEARRDRKGRPSGRGHDRSLQRPQGSTQRTAGPAQERRRPQAHEHRAEEEGGEVEVVALAHLVVGEVEVQGKAVGVDDVGQQQQPHHRAGPPHRVGHAQHRQQQRADEHGQPIEHGAGMRQERPLTQQEVVVVAELERQCRLAVQGIERRVLLAAQHREQGLEVGRHRLVDGRFGHGARPDHEHRVHRQAHQEEPQAVEGEGSPGGLVRHRPRPPGVAEPGPGGAQQAPQP